MVLGVAVLHSSVKVAVAWGLTVRWLQQKVVFQVVLQVVDGVLDTQGLEGPVLPSILSIRSCGLWDIHRDDWKAP